MLKFFSFLQSRIQITELKLSRKLEQRLAESYATRLFYFELVILNIQLVFWQISTDLAKFVIILFSDPGNSFNLFFRQRELRSCPYSYNAFKRIQAKIRIFSLAGASTLVAVAVLSSLLTNFIFGPKKPTYAATFGWLQTSFLGGATTTPAVHPGNQTGWSYFFSKDSGINITASGTVQLALINASTTQTTDANFNAGSNSSTTVANNSIALTKDLYVNEYTVGHLANINVTVTAVSTSSPWLLTLSGTPDLSRIFKNDKFTDSAGKAWKVLSLNPSTSAPRLLVIDSEGNGGSPATGAGTAGRWFADLAAWETGRQGNLVTRNAIERALPYYDVGPDVSPLVFSGWTTNSTHYIEINVPLSERHRGKWDDNKYRIEVNGGGASIDLTNTALYLTIDGLQISKNLNSNQYSYGIQRSVGGASGSVTISNNIIRFTADGSTHNYETAGISWNAYGTFKIFNNIVYGFNLPGTTSVGISAGADTACYVYNNTVYGNGVGIVGNGENFKNNIVNGNTTDYSGSFGAASVNNISQDATSPNATLRSKTVVFVSTSTKDFHLEFNDASAKDAGVDLSADANLPIAADIDGDTRSGTWDIGADDVGAVYTHVSSIGTNSRNFSTFQTWETARDGNLTTRKVFKISSQSGAFTSGETITGGTSGATGVYVPENATPSASETYMTLDGGSGTFQAGETLSGGTSSSTAVLSSIITTAGTIEKGEAYNDSVFTAGVTIAGSTVNATHYLWLTVEPRSRNYGIAGKGVKVDGGTITGNVMTATNQYVIFDGFEITDWGTDDNNERDAFLLSANCILRNNLIHDPKQAVSVRAVGVDNSVGAFSYNTMYNNAIYNFNNSNVGVGIYYYRNDQLYNNSIYNIKDNSNYNIPLSFNDGNSSSEVYVKNNISANCPTVGCFQNINGAPGDTYINYNISTDGTAAGTNSKTLQTLSGIRFVSTNSSLIDLHLMPSSIARNIGVDLSSAFKTDQEGQARPTGSNAWDIGVDEWQSSSVIYNNSGNFTSASIDLGAKANPQSMSLNPLSQTSDAKLWVEVAGNNDNATWNYKPLNEYQYPQGVTVDEKLVRENCTGYSNCYTTVTAALAAYSNKDLVAQNKIAAIKIDGVWRAPEARGGTLYINTWTTGPNNFIRIYTTPQARHDGKWNDSRYRMFINGGSYSSAFNLGNNSGYVRIEGLQIENISPSGYAFVAGSTVTDGDAYFNDNIVRGNGVNGYGVTIQGGRHAYIYNNIIYDLASSGIQFDTDTSNISSFVYNNTIYNISSYWGISIYGAGSGSILLKNNLVQNTAGDNYYGTFDAASSNNISSDASSPNATLRSKTVSFVGLSVRDLHLASGDTSAKDAGVDLSADSDLPFSTDVEGHARNIGVWDIGASEYGASGGMISSSLDSSRYIRYRVYFDTPDITQTPTLNDITLNYNSLPATASFISSPFNTGDVSNILAKLEWAETLATSSDITFQLRTSADGISWGSWLGPDGTSGTYYTDPSGSEAIPASLADGTGDKWIQYQATLLSDGVNSPTLSSVNVTYVVNATPEIQIATSTPIFQSASGTIGVSYLARDPDTLTGLNPNTVQIGLDYCTANCNATGTEVWAQASQASLTGQAGTTTVEQTNWSSYALTWDPNLDFDNQVLATSSFKIRLRANDGEGANNIGYSVSDNFSLDTRDPVITSFIVDGRATSSNIYVNATDDHIFVMEVSPNSNFSGSSPQAYVATSTFDLSAKPAELYLRLTDEYNNISTSSVTLPETPTAMMIQDNSNMISDPNEFRLFIAWKVPTDPVAGFSHYQIDRSTDDISWSQLTQASTRAVNYYGDSTTVKDQNYYYRVSVMDTLGNFSYLSDTVNGKANGTQDAGEGGGGVGASGVPPVISSIAATSTFSTQITIEWQTDILSDSLVYTDMNPDTDFSTSTGVSVATLRNDAANYGLHSVVIPDLTPSSTYYYIVKSTAINGAAATSTKQQFTTLPGPVIADDVQATSITNSEATISWTTDLADSSYVRYSTSSELANPTEVGTIDLTTAHAVALSNLAPGTTYYFSVRSGTGRRDHAEGQTGYYSFQTTQDTEPPVISNVRCGHTADTTLAVLWDTNEPSSGSVSYGVQSATYASTTVENTNLNLDHQFDLENLLASTTYYFVVNSHDQNGYAATSTEYFCSTDAPIKTAEEIQLMVEQAKQQGKAEGQQSQTGGGGGVLIIDKTDKIAPEISDIKVGNVKAGSADVSWLTNEDANAFVRYGTTTDYGHNIGLSDLLKSHNLFLDNLVEQNVYHYRVESADASGNLTTSSDFSFTTPTLEAQLESEGKTVSEIKKLAEQAKKKEEDKSKIIIEAAKKAMDLVRDVANQVSLGTLEQVVSGQFETIEQLAKVIPAPILGGQPTVITTPTTATISWTTDREANSMVAYAPENRYLPKGGDQAYLQTIGQADDFAKSHLVRLADLKPDMLYHFQLHSKGKLGPAAVSRDFTFRTQKEVLEIINYASKIEGNDTVSFQWSTNLDADSEVIYTPYRNGKLEIEERQVSKNKEGNTIHNVTLNQVSPGTIYQIILASTDKKKNRVEKTIEQFSTTEDKTAPQFITVQTESALAQGKDQRVQTVITWTTNEPTIGQLSYEPGINATDEKLQEKFVPEIAYAKKHMALITKFKPGQIYTFRIAIKDYSGNQAVSKPYTILAPRQKESVFQLILKNFEDIFNWIGKIGD